MFICSILAILINRENGILTYTLVMKTEEKILSAGFLIYGNIIDRMRTPTSTCCWIVALQGNGVIN
jgi:hypothetical protein